MAVFSLENEHTTKLPERKFLTSEQLDSSLIYNKEKPLDTIQNFIEGSKWEVDYFLQLRAKDDRVKELDINLPPAIQKYYRINNLVIYVTTPINQDDPQNVYGEGTINANVLVNFGDMILTTLSGGRKALLSIDTVDTKTYSLHNMFYVKFKLYGFVDEHPLYYDNIINKVVREFYYNRNTTYDGSNPVLLDVNYVQKVDLKIEYECIIKHYLKYFYNTENSLLCLTSTNNELYVDPYVINVFRKFTEVEMDTRIAKMRMITSHLTDKVYTIWDILLTRTGSMLDNIDRDLCFVRNSLAGSDIDLGAINNVGIDYIIDVKYGGTKILSTPDLREISMERKEGYKDPISKYIFKPKSNYIPMFGFNDQPEPKNNDTYIFSNYFYDRDTEKCGYMELMVINFLEGKVVKEDELYYALKNYKYWSTIDQFYLLPILLIILKDYLKSIIKVI